MANIEEIIELEVAGWPGVEERPHGFSGIEFRVNGHEIGRLHGERFPTLADPPFPVRVRKELVEAGKTELHQVPRQTGWISYRMRGEEDVEWALELFRLNYERPTARNKGVWA